MCHTFIQLTMLFVSLSLVVGTASSQNSASAYFCKEVLKQVEQKLWWARYSYQTPDYRNQNIREIYLTEQFTLQQGQPVKHNKRLLMLYDENDQLTQYFVQRVTETGLQSELYEGSNLNLQRELGAYSCSEIIIHLNTFLRPPDPRDIRLKLLQQTPFFDEETSPVLQLLSPIYDSFLPQPTLDNVYLAPIPSSENSYKVDIPIHRLNASLATISNTTTSFEQQHIDSLTQFYANEIAKTGTDWTMKAYRPSTSQRRINLEFTNFQKGSLEVQVLLDADRDLLTITVNALRPPSPLAEVFQVNQQGNGNILTECDPLIYQSLGSNYLLGLRQAPSPITQNIYCLIEYYGTETHIDTEIRRDKFSPYVGIFLPSWATEN